MALELVVTPGAVPDTIRVLNMASYFHVRTDAQGKTTFPLLIPGATYRVAALEPGKGWTGKVEFRAAAGKTVKLPDVVLHRVE